MHNTEYDFLSLILKGVVLENIPASLTRLAYLRQGAVIGDVTAKMEVMKLTVVSIIIIS